MTEFHSDLLIGFNLIAAVPPGLILEFGVAEGQSLSVIACSTARTVYGFDWFHGLPDDWGSTVSQAKDLKGYRDCGGKQPVNLPGNAVIVEGLVEDTLGPFLSQFPFERLAFAHFDMDLYAPTLFCLRQLGPRIQVGTVLMFDEIVNAGGETVRNDEHEGRAFREFMAENPNLRFECVGKRHPEALAFRVV
jgi:hypothetical protein